MTDNIRSADDMETGTPEQQATMHLSRAMTLVARGLPDGVVINALATVLAHFLSAYPEDERATVIAAVAEAASAQTPVMQ